MNYAEVAVNSPGSRSTYCYVISSQLDLNVGQAVWVPFGSRIIQGIVVELSDLPSVEGPKEIKDIITDFPLLTSVQIELARWMSEYYFSPLFDSLALMLPPGFERKLVTYFQLTTTGEAISSLTLEQRQIVRIIEERKRVSSKDVEKAIGKKKARQVIDQLLYRRVIIKNIELKKVRIKPKTLPYISLIAGREDTEAEIVRLNKSRAYKQAELLKFLTEHIKPVSINEIRERLNCSSTIVKALESRHLISIEKVNVRRDPLAHLDFISSLAPILTSSQQAAIQSIDSIIVSKVNQSDSSPVFLLFGVTGSGKTEVYLKALKRVVDEGKQGICLVPEIALTPQTVGRFVSRFPGRVAVLHSGLSLGEQFDEWQWIKEGNCDVVIGPRSALFAPLPDLGLIIIDEEHEWTYKQEDRSPRYHARDVAMKIAQFSKAIVILGSATPDVGSFYKAQLGEYRLIEMKERITPRGYVPLPEVNIVDLKEELKAGNTNLFSRCLSTGIKETLARGEQIILFLNRRGTATFIQCRKCGFAFRCPRCSVALTYHSVEKKLTCHRCHYSIPVPQVCPRCNRSQFRFLGVGTQRVEDEARRLVPEAGLLRWDTDATTKKRAHEELLNDFRNHKADILIGTQMIAKGLDLPQVTLAGIINADTGLNFPDFRSGERTFQLLCQVAGRAGRGVKAGKVIIQTYSPENYAIKAAAKHDYVGFYKQEIDYRRRYDYPPFSRFIRLVYSHTNEELCHREVERVNRLILDEKTKDNMINLSLIGPVPAFASRVRGRYRWQLFLRGLDPIKVLSQITLPQGWTVDVDPVGVI